jgi:hypothetical protein
MTLPLTPEERKVVGEYLRAQADRLGLRDWTFEFKHEPAADHLAGTIEATFGQRVAYIKLAHNFRDLEGVEQRETLIHELLHVHRESIRHYFDEVLPDLIGRPAFIAVTQAYRVLDELATDAVAQSIAGFYPGLHLPPQTPPEPVAP